MNDKPAQHLLWQYQAMSLTAANRSGHTMEKNWQQALIAVIERELGQLEWLIKCERAGEEDVERGDVHAQIERLGGLTDLADPEGLPVSETTAAKLRQLNEVVMGMVRSRLSNI
ncbi:hypothetical protein [Pseudomonas savastanoi]|uniref:hypothetical protein n=1 Tax=Pseudomonas savastanoi TaxID=29438 RepID=UPI001F425073|nr:hypothetical protein [Pseudomonas savastanoi]MBN4180673.1 hypothetical protein [Pseudomonas savastanoi pv. phaseolicola]